jgi:hypothetical protein
MLQQYIKFRILTILHDFVYFISAAKISKVKVKQSIYRPGVAQRLPGS